MEIKSFPLVFSGRKMEVLFSRGASEGPAGQEFSGADLR